MTPIVTFIKLAVTILVIVPTVVIGMILAAVIDPETGFFIMFLIHVLTAVGGLFLSSYAFEYMELRT